MSTGLQRRGTKERAREGLGFQKKEGIFSFPAPRSVFLWFLVVFFVFFGGFYVLKNLQKTPLGGSRLVVFDRVLMGFS